MCILYLSSPLFHSCLCCRIILSVHAVDIIVCLRICLLGDSGGIGTQVCDQTDSSLSLDVNTFIQLLGDSHRLRDWEIQRLRRLLLQRTRGKRKRCFLHPLPFLHFENLKLFLSHFRCNAVHLLLRRDRDTVLLISVELCN